MFLRRERFVGLGDDLTSAAPASIDARMEGYFVRLVLLVELRTDTDFHVIAAPEQRHDSSSYAYARSPCPDYAEWLHPADASLANLRQ
jgi:hypothetical protein